MVKMDGQGKQVTACSMSIEPGGYNNTTNIQHKVGDACTLCICLVYINSMARMLNEIVLAVEVLAGCSAS